MIFTDTHCHLNDELFNDDREQMIERAIQAGVGRFFIPNVNLSTVDGLMKLSERYPENCFPMMGLHPCDITEDWTNQIEIIDQHLRYGKFYAVGEIGIDLHWDKTTFEMQRAAFIYQCKLAMQLKLPVSIHSRNATLECLHIIEKNQLFTGGVFHCFGGTLEQALQAIEMGFYIGVGGVVTYKNSSLPELLKQIPLEKIVLETDSPYLPPVPFRGKRNESAFITEIAKKIAQIKMVSLKEVAEHTTMNSKNIFGV